MFACLLFIIVVLLCVLFNISVVISEFEIISLIACIYGFA